MKWGEVRKTKKEEIKEKKKNKGFQEHHQ